MSLGKPKEPPTTPIEPTIEEGSQKLGTAFVGHRCLAHLAHSRRSEVFCRRGAMSRLRPLRLRLKLSCVIKRREQRIRFHSAAALCPRAAPIWLGRSGILLGR